MIVRNTSGWHRSAGFTLIELMITIVIVSILLSIVIPSYQSQVRKSRRTEARQAVLDLASREERFLSTSNVYSATPADVGYAGANWAAVGAVGSGYYTLNVQVPDPAFAGPATTPSYIITATTTGSQIKDVACATFSINQIGTQAATGSGGATATATCWGN